MTGTATGEGTPVLGLLMGLRRPPQWAPLVVTLTRWCEPRLADGTGDPPACWLASAPDAPRLGQALAGGGPVAVLAADPGAAALPVQVVVWTGPPAAAPADDRVVLCSPEALDADDRSPTTPFVRARWRAARGLPTDLVVHAAALPDDIRPTALALAAAVVATEPARLVEALAWGAPCVTDAEAAAAVGAVDGTHVVTAPAADHPRAAAALARDLRTGAALGRAGRRLVEERHDLTGTARAVAERLGVGPRPPRHHAAAIVERQLDRLRTPATARVRSGAATAVAVLDRTGDAGG